MLYEDRRAILGEKIINSIVLLQRCFWAHERRHISLLCTSLIEATLFQNVRVDKKKPGSRSM